MEHARLGRTNLTVSRTAFGVLPIQRTPKAEAVRILRLAHDGGITFFDTARAYSDSEEKLGAALGRRKDIIIATKTFAKDRKELLAHLGTSLKNLRRDHVDILQLHNSPSLPSPEDAGSTYAGLLEARKRGMTRFIGISSHRIAIARKAVRSGLYDTLQFPLSAISAEKDLALSALCRRHDVGLIAMKALCGGLLTDVPAAFAFLRQYGNVVPIWGIQHRRELDEILALEANPPALDAKMLKRLARLKKELGDDFCRGCGYCLPCPAQIPIPMAARMSFLLRRAPWRNFVTDEWRDWMERIADCTNCGACHKRCPYGLDTPRILRGMLKDYRKFCRENVGK